MNTSQVRSIAADLVRNSHQQKRNAATLTKPGDDPQRWRAFGVADSYEFIGKCLLGICDYEDQNDKLPITPVWMESLGATCLDEGQYTFDKAIWWMSQHPEHWTVEVEDHANEGTLAHLYTQAQAMEWFRLCGIVAR